MTEEIWRDVPGYEGLYQVSNMGNLKASNKIDERGRQRKERVMSNKPDNTGYVIKEWDSVANASRTLNISSGNIASVARGERNICGGYKWAYK